MTDDRITFETGQPWVVYRFGLTHDLWWPPLTSTRVTGRAKIQATCAICGAQEVLVMKIPRFREIPDRGHHPLRLKFLADHVHPDQGAPMSWALPLLNPDAHPEGINLDALAMRLEADINETKRWLGGTPLQHQQRGHDVRSVREEGRRREFTYCVTCHWAFRDSKKAKT